MSDHPYPGAAPFNGCPYCGDDSIEPEGIPAHIPSCDAVPTTDEVVDALEQRGLF